MLQPLWDKYRELGTMYRNTDFQEPYPTVCTIPRLPIQQWQCTTTVMCCLRRFKTQTWCISPHRNWQGKIKRYNKNKICPNTLYTYTKYRNTGEKHEVSADAMKMYTRVIYCKHSTQYSTLTPWLVLHYGIKFLLCKMYEQEC